MDVLVVGGAWALGSVAVSLLVGAVVARAERPLDVATASAALPAPAAAFPADRAPRTPAVLPLALPAPRTSAEQAVTTS